MQMEIVTLSALSYKVLRDKVNHYIYFEDLLFLL